MKLIHVLGQIGSFNIEDINLVEGYFYSLEHAKQQKIENDKLKAKSK